MRVLRTLGLSFLAIILTGCSDAATQGGGKSPDSAGEAARATALPELDSDRIETILGITGSRRDGQFKVALPQDELSVSVDGFAIIPPMGLTSWAAFAPAGEGAVVMGDLVLQEDEIGPVEKALVASGLTVSALHNHFVRDRPKAMFMHIHGAGPQEDLAQAVRAALDKIRELRRAKNLTGGPSDVATTFDPATIDSILGHSGEMNSGVYKVTIGRPDIELSDHGARVTAFMGFNTWMAFQGTPQRSAVCGDFAMLGQEVAPVIEALVEHGIEVVAVHNHMLAEAPRIFFLHFWGVGPVESLARGLKAGLARTGAAQQAAATRFDFEGAAPGRIPSG